VGVIGYPLILTGNGSILCPLRALPPGQFPLLPLSPSAFNRLNRMGFNFRQGEGGRLKPRTGPVFQSGNTPVPMKVRIAYTRGAPGCPALVETRRIFAGSVSRAAMAHVFSKAPKLLPEPPFLPVPENPESNFIPIRIRQQNSKPNVSRGL